MSDDQTKLWCLGIITGCSVIAMAVATLSNKDVTGLFGLMVVASLVWFIVKYIQMKP